MLFLRFLVCSALVMVGVSQGPMDAAFSLFGVMIFFVWLWVAYDGSRRRLHVELALYVLAIFISLLKLAFGPWALFIFMLASPVFIGLWAVYLSFYTRALTLVLSSPDVASRDATSQNSVAMTATFSESVTGFSGYKIDTSNCSVDAFTGSGATYTFRVIQNEGGNARVRVLPGQIYDTDHNENQEAYFYIVWEQPVSIPRRKEA